MEQLTLDIEGFSNESLTDRQTDQPQTLDEKIERSQKTLRLAADMSKTYYGQPLIITYSGGKDSDVMLHLAESCLKADDFEVLNSHTSVDAPETVYHIREVFKRLNDKGIKTTIHFPKDKNGNHITMWKLIEEKGIAPTRMFRFCCSKLKETATPNRLACLGVRAAESANRQGRNTFAIVGSKVEKAKYYSFNHAMEVHQEAKELNDPVWDCTLIKSMREHGSCVVHPIYDWQDRDIWDYIFKNQVKVNPLYKRGYTRVGCIGCPLAGYKTMKKEFSEYPTYERAYINAFEKMLRTRKEKGMDEKTTTCHGWKTGQDVFDWWIEENKYNVKGQLSLFDDEPQA